LTFKNLRLKERWLAAPGLLYFNWNWYTEYVVCWTQRLTKYLETLELIESFKYSLMKKVFLPSLFLLQKSMCYFHICLLYFPGKSLKEINRDYQNDGITPTYNSTPHLSDEDEFLQNWSASPRITSHQQKSKSLSRLDSVPKYIRRERELDKRASNSALA